MYEHPWRASSWKLQSVKKVQRHPKVYSVTKKRTTIMTNHAGLAEQLQARQCPGDHTHRPIEGSERGYSMSRWCQTYPAPLVEILAAAMS